MIHPSLLGKTSFTKAECILQMFAALSYIDCMMSVISVSLCLCPFELKAQLACLLILKYLLDSFKQESLRGVDIILFDRLIRVVVYDISDHPC